MAAARESAEAAVNANEQAARDTSKWRRWRCCRLRASTPAPQAPAPEMPAPETPAPETPPPGCVRDPCACHHALWQRVLVLARAAAAAARRVLHARCLRASVVSRVSTRGGPPQQQGQGWTLPTSTWLSDSCAGLGTCHGWTLVDSRAACSQRGCRISGLLARRGSHTAARWARPYGRL